MRTSLSRLAIVFAALVLLCSPARVYAQHSGKAAGVADISHAVAQEEPVVSVYEALANHGITNLGEATPTLILGDRVFLGKVELEDERVTFRSQASDQGSIIATFTLNEHGSLVMRVSDEGGGSGFQLTLPGRPSATPVPGDGANVDTCRCYGGGANVVRRPCTTTQCDDVGTSCSVTVGVVCQWRDIDTSFLILATPDQWIFFVDVQDLE